MKKKIHRIVVQITFDEEHETEAVRLMVNDWLNGMEPEDMKLWIHDPSGNYNDATPVVPLRMSAPKA